jgi:Protein of unknown function (DUF551)
MSSSSRDHDPATCAATPQERASGPHSFTTTTDAIDYSIREMQTLQRQGEDRIWRPATRAEKALLMAREELNHLRAHLALLPTHGWQPIETAPKDGSWFLAFYESPNARAPRVGPMRWDRDEPIHTLRAFRSYAIMTESKRATHWMPLPAPPMAPLTRQDGTANAGPGMTSTSESPDQ